MTDTPKPRIVLLTMVKNEEKNVRRLFESVRGWIDGYVLCDTGSTDGTIGLANSLMKEFGKPGKVYEYPWKNFGVSRTKSFQCFQEWVAEVGWDPETTYGLLLDGDMILPEEKGLHAKLAGVDVKCGGAQISQRNGSLLYKNTRLLRASKTWRCIGATHEYWGCDNGDTIAFDEPIITDIGDGGCKADKYPRDAALLEEELKTDPKNVRTLFYLGQTYMSLGRNEDAVSVLTKRIDIGGWEEEKYIAHLYKGDCLKNLGRKAEAVDEWLKAWQLRQQRTEAALRLIQYYRQQPSMAFIASIFAEKLIQIQTGETIYGNKVSEPARNNDILFVSHRDMVYPIWEELGIISYYTGNKVHACRYMDNKSVDPALSFNEHNRMLDLYRWYAWRLPVTKREALSVDATAIPWIAEGFWRAFNPSIRKSGDRYVVNLRHANYQTKDARHYEYRALTGSIITRNVVVTMDEKFKVDLSGTIKPFELSIPAQYIVNKSTYIHGIEDCRWLGDSSFIGTSRQFSVSDMNKMVRVDINYDTNTIHPPTVLQAPIPSEDNNCQKNWLPFVWKGEEYIVYKINPFQVYRLSDYKKVVDFTPAERTKVTFDNMRGSAPPVPWSSAARPNEALVLVAHFCYYGSGNEGRRYYHRFITMDSSLKPSRMSNIFTLCDDAIQYVSGMCEAITKGYYVLSYGVNDSQAWGVEVANTVIEASLTYAV